MKRKRIIFLIIILAFVSCNDQNNLAGKSFVAFEEDIYFDSPSELFQSILTFKKDSVLLERNSISINDKDTLNFKFTGEHYRYKGLVKKDKTNIKFIAFANKCGECPVFTEVNEKGEIKDVLDQKEFKGFVTNNGIKLNGVNFKLK